MPHTRIDYRETAGGVSFVYRLPRGTAASASTRVPFARLHLPDPHHVPDHES